MRRDPPTTRRLKAEPDFIPAIEEASRKRKQKLDSITRQFRPVPKPSKTKKQEKAKSDRETLVRRKEVYEIVDLRDGRCCQTCGSPYIEHHHINFGQHLKYDDPENIVCLCWYHHRLSDDAPHNGELGRQKWLDWQAERFPEYVERMRKNEQIKQMPNLQT